MSIINVTGVVRHEVSVIEKEPRNMDGRRINRNTKDRLDRLYKKSKIEEEKTQINLQYSKCTDGNCKLDYI